MSSEQPVTVGAYAIVREIGRGGMGIVYLAHDERLDRDVAIKALPEHLVDDPDRLARFEREGRSLAQLNHPNIAAIHGVEEQQGKKYLVLEYVEGQTLGERLDRGPLPFEEAIEVAVEIAAGLASAHEAGVVHLDLKPDNIKLTPDGRVKLLDFGLARTTQSGSSHDLVDAPTVAVSRSPTAPGAVLGTAAYMSPEQARGRSVDKRSDVWSFGVVRYEMLTGANPFDGETASDSIGAVLHKKVALDRAPLDTSVESSEPERLFRVPIDLSTEPIEVMEVPDEAHWGPSAWFCWTPAGEIAMLNRRDSELILVDPGDGSELRRLHVKWDGPRATLGGLMGPFGDQHIPLRLDQFTDDGFQFACAAINLETGTVTIIVEDAGVAALTPDGDVVFVRDDTIMRSPFDSKRMELTGDLRIVQSGLGTDNHWSNGSFRLADSGTLLYEPGGMRGQSREIVFIERDGSRAVWFDERRSYAESIAVSPDGSRLAVQLANPSGLYEIWVSETDRPRLRRLFAEPGADLESLQFTPDGEHVIAVQWTPTSEEQSNVVIAPFSGDAPPRQVAGGWTRDMWIELESVSSDGRNLLATITSQGQVEVHEIPIEQGNDASRFLFGNERVFSPRYAPTSDPLIAYVSTETGRAEAFVRVVTDDGVGPAIPITTRGAWSFEWMVDDKLGLCVMHFDLQWIEWITPVSFENGKVDFGDPIRGRTGDTRHEALTSTRDGRYVAIRRGPDEKPTTHLELVQGWLDSIESK